VIDPNPVASVSDADDLRERLWAYEDFSAAQEHPSIDVTGSFASLGYLGAALGRTKRFWLGMTVVGFLAGCAIFVGLPPAHSATATVLLTPAAGSDPNTTMLTDQSLAASDKVAQQVISQLKLSTTPQSLLANVNATAITEEVLQITVKAKKSDEAVAEANAFANDFLTYRAGLLTTQEQQEAAPLNADIATALRSVTAVGNKITRLYGSKNIPKLAEIYPPWGSPPKTPLQKLQQKYSTAATNYETVQSNDATTIQQNEIAVDTQISGSQVLDQATAAKYSVPKYIAYYIGGGLLGGLVLGIVIIIIRALVSDRLRRRDDIAAAFGAPVKLSVGPLTKGTARTRDLQLITAHLRGSIPGGGQGPAALAVVPVGNTRTVAPAVAAVAQACAGEGQRVAVADLTDGAAVARVLGARSPGVQRVQVGNAPLVVMVPNPGDPMPAGPRQAPGGALGAAPDEKLMAAYQSADLLLTIAELDPAAGGEYLTTWATDAVAIVTAGHTHGQKAYSVGEMLRTSGVHLRSVVLVDADKDDLSLGIDVPAAEFVPGA
jgi:capsular polysaccharide biosynthesis protein